MQKNRVVWLKWIAIICGIVGGIGAVIAFVVSGNISENFIQEKVEQVLEDRFPSAHRIGTVSLSWPNQIVISQLVIEQGEKGKESPIVIEDIHGRLKLIPLLFKKFVVKKLSARQINYKNQVLVKGFITNYFSIKNDKVDFSAHLNINDGPAALKGTIEVHRKEPVFNILFDAKDMHITQDVPMLQLLPLFRVREGEIGGMMSVNGYARGEGRGKNALNEKLDVNANLTVRDGYIKGNKLLSSILDIIGAKDTYSFQTMEAIIQIRDSRINTPKMDVQGPVMSLTASGMTSFDGTILYEAMVRFDKKYLGKNAEKVADLFLREDAIPFEIRGTTKNPRVSVKLNRDKIDQLVKGLLDDFLSKKEKRKNEKN